MANKCENEDSNYSLSYLGAGRISTMDGNYFEFNVETLHGIVAGWGSAEGVSLTFISGGRKYRRRIRKGFAWRSVITIARRFAAEKSK
jgi:hypothetical protein